MSATTDRRRNPPPEVSIPLVYEPLVEERQAGPSIRTDRRDLEARPIFLNTGLITQANGSGYIEAGGVKIACSVYGPRPKPPPYSSEGSLNLEVKFAPFASDPRRAPLRDTEPLPLSILLTQLLLPTIHLHRLPKSIIDVHLLILESDTLSNVLSAGLNVASAAVADAGIEMAGLGVGNVVSKLKNGKVVLDPTKDEEVESEAKVMVGTMPAVGKVTDLWLTGEIAIDEACLMIEKAITASRETHAILGQTLIEGAEERGV
ncbi:uncharacterized protein L203_102445 [Cryptococcus depauperatus CBS 7841]|uniref:Uncharacterized protein n=1 Tax=Cryptococcus depauperatus CBS 7841 TaxID=1295531 RepID=A0A1E3HH38_9TREE|nr:hypothetical protein L203_06518 [Cryptococcus depauperatus CBS 7841]